MSATLHTDGGARGNPGHAGIGFALQIGDEPAVEVGRYIGKTTNNQAEYQALIAGLQEAKERDVQELRCFLDSELIVKQLKGQYRVKNVDLKPLYAEVQALQAHFGAISFTHVRREKNKVADRLVNEAIDKYLK